MHYKDFRNVLLPCSVLPDIQNLNSNAIAPQYFNRNLSREICSNHMLCQDSRITLLEVLNRPTTDVDFWTAFLRGKDGWLQPLKLYATYSGVEQLSGKTKTTWNRSALVEVSCCYQSQPLALCSNSFGSPIFLKCKCSQTHWHNFQAICFPNLSISIKHRQIGGQSVRFALHERFSIEVGCRFAWHRIRWFQQSRDSYFKTHLLEALNSSRHRPKTSSNKSGLLNISGLPSPSRWQRLQPQAVAYSEAEQLSGIRSSGSLMLLAAIRNALQRLPECAAPLLSLTWHSKLEFKCHCPSIFQ